MSDPVLHQEKLLRPVVLMLEKGAGQDKDETLQVLSLRALGNMALGAPRKVPNWPWSKVSGLGAMWAHASGNLGALLSDLNSSR